MGAIGCDAFTGTLPGASPWFHGGAIDYPKNATEARERPICTTLATPYSHTPYVGFWLFVLLLLEPLESMSGE